MSADIAPSWKLQAVCRGMDADLWFPSATEWYVVAKAKRICWQCPVRDECLDAGIDEPHGIWGGMTPDERHRRKRRLRKVRSA